MAKLVKAPFVKVEATKFTEVGYVGRDVDQMIRDLVENSVRMVKEEMMEGQQEKRKNLPINVYCKFFGLKKSRNLKR